MNQSEIIALRERARTGDLHALTTLGKRLLMGQGVTAGGRGVHQGCRGPRRRRGDGTTCLVRGLGCAAATQRGRRPGSA